MDRYSCLLLHCLFEAVWIFECSVLLQLGYGDTEDRGGCTTPVSSLVSPFWSLFNGWPSCSGFANQCHFERSFDSLFSVPPMQSRKQ